MRSEGVESPGAAELDAHYADLFGGMARLFPGLLHLHYGLAEAPVQGIRARIDALGSGPARLLDDVIELARLAELPRGFRGLDLGCGLAGTSLRLAERFGARMVGLDRSFPQLEVARGRIRARGGSVALAQAGAPALPFRAASFDVVVSIEVTFHVADKAALFAELARILAPGGRLVLVDQEMSAGAIDALGFFHFAGVGELVRCGRAVGLEPWVEEDLSARVAHWMHAYEWSSALSLQAGMLAWAGVRGGPRLAARLLRGMSAYHRAVRRSAAAAGIALPGLVPNGIRSMRRHTRQCLERGETSYKLLVLRSPDGTPNPRGTTPAA